MRDVLFLTWIEHRRTRQLCARLNLPLVELISTRSGLSRYLALTLRTVRILLNIRPKVLLVQSPSVVLAFVALLLRPMLQYVLVLDAHNEAVEPHLHSSVVVRRLTYFLLRKANLVVVTNRQLAAHVLRRGGHPLVLPDGIPAPPPITAKPLRDAFTIVLISTFAGDEPFDVVVDAARQIGSATHFYVTGNPHKLPLRAKQSLPHNITLTGFLGEEDYWCLLASADAVMDLTTMDNCLVCGAYEAVAVNRPLLLSRNEAGEELFADLAVFTENDASSLVDAVTRLRNDYATRVAALPAARKAFEARWSQHAEGLRRFIDSSGAY